VEKTVFGIRLWGIPTASGEQGRKEEGKDLIPPKERGGEDKKGEKPRNL